MPHPTTRVFTLLELLQAREVSGGAELATALGVDRRTLRRYIVMLEEMGIPITTTQGRFGGYSVIAGFKLPPMIFSDDEALALAMGLMAARNLGLASTLPAVTSAHSKLERVFPHKLKQRLVAVDGSVAMELVRPAAAVDPKLLSQLCTATQERRRVHLAYRSPKDESTQRDFDSYGLVYREGRWYIVGHCHLRRGLRSFRLDRVTEVKPLAVSFERPASFDALEHLRESIAKIPRAHSFEVLLATDLARAQCELRPTFGVLEWTEDGVLMRGQSERLDWVARELARLSFDFVVIAPQALRNELARTARRMARLARAKP